MAKRIKRVFNSWSQVMHIWAQQQQDNARSSNMSFEGATLYSYATPIARFVTRKRNKKKDLKAVLVSTVNYSKTTSAQQGAISRAIDTSKYTVINCRFIGRTGGRLHEPYNTDMHTYNLKCYAAEYKDNIYKLTKAKAEYRVNACINTANYNKAQAKAYCSFFGLRFKSSMFPPIKQDIINAARLRAASHARSETLKYARQKEYRRTSVITAILAYLNSNITDSYLPWDWKEFADDELKQKVLIKRELDLRQKRIDWRNGARSAYTHGLFDTVAMRINYNTDEIETSQGASFSLDHATKAFPLIKACVDHKQAWYKNGHSIYLGNFSIDSISETGTVKAGCHTVLYEEIEKLAKELGLTHDVTNRITHNTNNI